MLTEAERAYLAGIFDGEGCIGYYKHGKGYCFSLIICNSDARIMNWLIAHVPFGQVVGNLSNKGRYPSHREMWQWQVGKVGEINQFIDYVLPYSILKLDQINLVLFHINSGCLTGRGHRLTDTMRQQRDKFVVDLKALKRVTTSLSIH